MLAIETGISVTQWEAAGEEAIATAMELITERSRVR